MPCPGILANIVGYKQFGIGNAKGNGKEMQIVQIQYVFQSGLFTPE